MAKVITGQSPGLVGIKLKKLYVQLQKRTNQGIR